MMEPLNPQVANTIVNSTIICRAMKVISKINKTTTLIKLILKHRNISDKDLDKERENLEYKVQK